MFLKQLRISEILKQSRVGETVTVSGWVKTRRDRKKFSFLTVNDGSCLSGIQVVADASLPGYKENVLEAHTGASVQVEGKLVASQGSKQTVELHAETVVLVGSCPVEEYPLQKKNHSFEFLRTIAHLRPRTNTLGAVFRMRSAASFAIHQFFQELGFLYLHTPIVTTSDCEGAGEMFQVTSLNIANPPQKSGAVDYTEDFFGAEASLTVSGQLDAENFACGLGNVYTFGPTFRAENSNTPRHLAEFWMIEPEMAFCDLEGDADVAEAFIKYVLRYLLENCEEDLTFFEEHVEEGLLEKLQAVVAAEFHRISYTEAIQALEKSGKTFEFPVHWGVDLQTEHERYLTEEYLKSPVFVTHYPKEIKAFYMRLDEGEKTVAAMDLLVPRVGEIIGGSQREERGDVLRRRIQECNLPEEAYWWYLDLRRFGTVPHAGFGLGLERLIMYCTGMQNIRDVIPFPRTPGNAGF